MPHGGPRTPEDKVRDLQERLRHSAESDKQRRFHQLYDKVASPWFLEVAWQRVKANRGAPGPDGVTIEEIEATGSGVFLDDLSRELRERRYQAGPVRRVYIPKANGKLRPLGIPNVRDRVVQASTLLVVEPIFEADLPDSAFGFRPGRNAHQAMARIADRLMGGRTEVGGACAACLVVDADLASYFDTIPHDNLLKLVARRIVDRGVLNLIAQWLRAPVIEPDDPPGSPGRRSDQGTPQGGVISPLLANLYHACIPHLWERRGYARTLGGEIVSYADDFVILLPPGRGRAALEGLRGICGRLSLRLNEDKTRVVNARQDRFQFLGFECRKVRNTKTGKWFAHTAPAAKSQQRLRDRLRDLTARWRHNLPVGQVVEDMNRVLRGWGHYFYIGNPQRAMERLNHFAEQRLRTWLMRRRQKRGKGYSHYPTTRLYEALGLYRLPTRRPGTPAHACG